MDNDTPTIVGESHSCTPEDIRGEKLMLSDEDISLVREGAAQMDDWSAINFEYAVQVKYQNVKSAEIWKTEVKIEGPLTKSKARDAVHKKLRIPMEVFRVIDYWQETEEIGIHTVAAAPYE